jgi:hypothetical protein
VIEHESGNVGRDFSTEEPSLCSTDDRICTHAQGGCAIETIRVLRMVTVTWAAIITGEDARIWFKDLQGIEFVPGSSNVSRPRSDALTIQLNY